MPGAKPPTSLKARALRWVSQREHSTVEMRRKLLDAVRRQVSAEPSGAHPEASDDGDDGVDDGRSVRSASARSLARSPEMSAEVDAVIAWLSANDFLSDQRFVESRMHARESSQGYSRIRRELSEHGLALPDAAAEDLRQTEFERASALCLRRFGDAPAASPSEDARRYRFLKRRGFSGDVVVRVLRDVKSATLDALSDVVTPG